MKFNGMSTFFFLFLLLCSKGGNRMCPIGLADERTGLQDEVEPWIRDIFWKSIIDQHCE